MSVDEHARRFTALRPLLFTIAYEILGTAAEAEDAVQESFIRWAAVDLDKVQDTRAYLAKIVTRQSLNAVRSRGRLREDYVGPWLPEPILLDGDDASHDVVLAESVSTAMLVVLESLSPEERVVFVLREVFGFAHDEIAGILDKSPAAVRQIAHRSRAHVQARRPRFEPVTTDEAEAVVSQFLRATTTGNVDDLLALLAPDVRLVSDGGGKASAVRHPIDGADKVARLLLGFVRLSDQQTDLRFESRMYNGLPGLVVHFDGRLQGVFGFSVIGGRIAEIYGWRNPDKLVGADAPRSITR